MRPEIYIFEPQRRIDNKIVATKDARRPVIVERTLSFKKVMLTLLFDTNGSLVQISVPRWQMVTGKFYQGRILGNLNNVDQKQG